MFKQMHLSAQTAFILIALLSCPTASAVVFDFESGDYTGWTVFGSAFGAAPAHERGHSDIHSWEGVYYVNTWLQGESAIGLLRSDTFTYTGPLVMQISGWNYHPGYHDTFEHHNYVRLKRASDSVELARVWAPNRNDLISAILEAPGHIGETVYLEVIDNASYDAYAWIAVDFIVSSQHLSDGDFESGHYGQWHVISGDAWGSAPATINENPNVSDFSGTYFADTLSAGEEAVGVLRSPSFTLRRPVDFRIAGHNHQPGQAEFHHNYVTLKLAKTGEELDRVWAPGLTLGENRFVERSLSAPAYIGQAVYLEAVDDSAASGYAWIAIDDVEFGGHMAPHNSHADTWAATDALGRALPGYDDVGAPRSDRYVGIFYFNWFGYHGTSGPYDIHAIQAAHPYSPALYPAVSDYLNELENYYGPFTESHFWGEPLFGYYMGDDDYVLRKHMQMLGDAGVDVLLMDNTNGFTYIDHALRLMSICQQIRDAGGNTPQLAWFVRENIIDNVDLHAVYNEIYLPELFPDLWFRWNGKPLLIVFDSDNPPSLDIPAHIAEFFEIRESWAFSGWSWFDDGYHKWPWIDSYPQAYGWDENPSAPEAMAVSIAQHPTTNIGRSFSNGTQPAFGFAPTEWGLCFEEQWNQALAVDPDFIWVTGWNEWVAGRWELGSPGWSDYGTICGVTRGPGQSIFVDAFDHEYSRDAEPVVGGHGDNYYYQLIDYVRQFKGVNPPPQPSAPHSIFIDGNFAEWESVLPEYVDQPHDPAARNDHPGIYSAGPYTNLSGRNDIVLAKVAYDVCNVYFYVETRKTLVAWPDSSRIELYIDIDQDITTGWQGYDYLIRAASAPMAEADVLVNVGDTYTWQVVDVIASVAHDRAVELAVPRALLGEHESGVAFDFKWADNVDPAGDVMRFTTHGDAAPNDRFNYRYENSLLALPASVDELSDCLMGPLNSTSSECLDRLDADFDDDIDLVDVAIQQTVTHCPAN